MSNQPILFLIFSLIWGVENCWARGENSQPPPFSLPQNHSNRTPLPQKISPILSSLFFIIFINRLNKCSLRVYLVEMILGGWKKESGNKRENG